MENERDLAKLPDNLPVPKDDGLADHLTGMSLPKMELANSNGGKTALNITTNSTRIFYCYPMTCETDEQPPDWDKIAGARGCTPQTLSIKHSACELQEINAEPIGISTQTGEKVISEAARIGIKHTVLSDYELKLTNALNLPTFQIGTQTYLKRLTMIVRDNTIIKTFYPIFPPDKHIFEVIAWLKN